MDSVPYAEVDYQQSKESWQAFYASFITLSYSCIRLLTTSSVILSFHFFPLNFHSLMRVLNSCLTNSEKPLRVS